MTPFTRVSLRSAGAQPRLRHATLALALAGAFGAAPGLGHAQTLPSGGVAVHGQATITQTAPNHLQVVTQNGAGTRHSAINWQSFSISAGSTASILQPDASSLSIHRVVTNTPSSLLGTLSSNGRLVLVNPSGIAVGAGAIIDTAGFTASALRMTDADALAGRLRFGEPGAAMGAGAGLTVGGTIRARDGDIVLVAPDIALGSSALLQADNGSTILAAGQQVEITGRGLEGISLLVQAPADQARNLGRLEGNAVGIFAGTLRHSGEIQATTATLEGGTVVLKAAQDAYVEGAGAIRATGPQGGKGGSVDVLGRRVAITDQAVVDVSGDAGGGRIRVGGDYQGRNAAVPNALRTYLGPDAQLRADANVRGDGGRIIVWGDEVTRAFGTISARGGLVAGNGGFAEVSGLHGLVFEADVDLRAPHGLIGTLLLDPDFIDIANVGSDPVGAGDEFADPSGAVVISPAALQAVGGNVMLQSNGDITFSDAVSLTAPGAGLTALAGNMIRVDAAITTNGGAVTLHSAAPGASGTGSNDSDAIYVNAAISSNGGTISLSANSCDLFCDGIVIGAPVNAGAGSIVMDSLGDIRQTGSGTLTAVNLSVNADAVIDLNLGGNNVTGDVSLITNLLTGGTSLVQFHNSASSFLLNNATAKGDINIAAAGSLSTNGSITSTAGNVAITALNGMSFGDDVSAAGTVTLQATNAAITQTAGGIVSGDTTLVIAGSGNIGLVSASNDFADIILEGGDIAVRAANALSVSGLTRNGTNRALTLIAGGALSLPAADIDAGTAQIDLRAGGLLSTPGQLTGGSILLNGSGGIALAHNVTVNNGVLQLTAAGGSITQSGGQITAPGSAQTVFNAAGVNVNLSAGNNDFGEIFGSTGSLTLVDQNSITVSSLGGGISSNTGDISLTATGIGALSLAGNVAAGTNNVSLSAHGSITQSGGAITANTVTASSSLGAITLDQAGNNLAAARVSASGAASVTVTDIGNLAISGTGGSLVATASGAITVDQSLNFAGSTALFAGTGIALAANTTASGNLTLSTTGGGIQQTAGVISAVGGTASISAGSSDIGLTNAANDFNVVNLTGNHITVLAGNGGLIVGSLSSGANANVFLQAGTGGLILPGTAINAGTGQISLISGSTLLGLGALSGSDILLQAPSGLDISANINATGTLLVNSGGTGVSQSGGAIAAAGAATVAAGTAPVSLAQTGNNFSSIGVTGGVVSVADSNGIVLNATNASTSLSVVANGNVGQSAAVIVSGTTTVHAGSGNVTLTAAGNNLNVLDVSGNAINVVEGAGSSLTVTSLVSGANQPVSLTAGHTLTLPGTSINTGTADITLNSTIGPLVIPASLNGATINLSSGQGLAVNAPINASGDFSATVAGDFLSTVNSGIQVAGTMGLALGGGLEIASVNQQSHLNAGAGQTINAKYIALSTTGTGSAKIYNQTGVQSITTQGQSGSGEGILVRNAGTGVGEVGIVNDGAAQTITVNNASALRVQGVSGQAHIHSLGAQTIVLQGASSANQLEVGLATSSGHSEIVGNTQTITAGQTGQSGGITILAGTADDHGAGIANDSGTQIVKTTGTIRLQGGTAPGLAGPDCVSTGGAFGGSCAFIGSNGAALQTVAATDIQLFGGTSGSLNLAAIANLNPAGTQRLEIQGGGDLSLIGGGGSGNGNRVIVQTAGVSQTVEWLAGGDLTLSAGGQGTRHSAHILMGNNTGMQTLTGATGITLTGGADGGGTGAGNSVIVRSMGSQTLTVGNGGIMLAGGGGSLADNFAAIEQNGGAGTSQSITITGTGNIHLQAGSSAGTGPGAGSEASIRSDSGDSQSIQFTGTGAGRAITITGGSVGEDAYAEIYAGSGTQSITGAGLITLTGGASGGGLTTVGGDTTGNLAAISADTNHQTIVADGIVLLGGAAGRNNFAVVYSGANQSITVGAAGIHLTGGGGGVSDQKNAAFILKGSDVPGTSQTITVGGGGSIVLQGGNATATNVAADGNLLGLSNGAFTSIRSDGTAQLIEFTGAGSAISVTGGSGGSNNHSFIQAAAGSQTIRGSSNAHAPAITLTGGASGGVTNEGNRAAILAEAGNQVVVAASIQLQGGGAGVENLAQIRQGGVSSGLSSTQTIDVVSGAGSSLQGGGGSTNLARIQSYGTSQTVTLAAGSTLDLVGGTGAGFNFARIEALNGNQTIAGSGAISVIGGASGGTAGQGNFADIRSRGASNSQSISARALTIAGGAGGIENDASVRADGNQTVSLQTAGANALVIGHAGSAHASSLTGNNQVITAGSGGQSGSITIVGGTTAGKNAGIFANVVTPNTGTQTISTTGTLSLTGGTASGVATCDVANSGACADIANDGSGLQSITAQAVHMQGGSSGIANGAGIFQRGGDLLLTVGTGGLTMTGGSGGSNNFATIGGANANGSTLTLDVAGAIVMDAQNATAGSGTLIGLGGVGSGNSVTIDITAAGSLTMRGSDVAATGSAIGANNTQTSSTTAITIDAGSVSMVGGSAGPARIGSSQTAPGGGDIDIVASGSVALQGAVPGNAVIHTLGRVDVQGDTLDVRQTIIGSEVALQGAAGVSLSGAASVSASGAGTALKVIVDSGAFSNTASASPLAAPNGRWLVYSVDPANDTRGNLVHDFKQYAALPADTVQGTGNGLLYSLAAPTATATLVGTVSKAYDGTTAATLVAGNYSATGIDGDVVVLNNPSAGTYDTKSVGTGKEVVAGGLSIVSVVDASGKPVFGYDPLVAPAVGLIGEITAATITAVTGITASDKVYDATTSATLSTGSAGFAGMAAGDNLLLSGATGTFDTKHVGVGKTVTITGFSLSGTDAANYVLGASSATATASITPASITAVTGITAGDKVYDGTTNATLTTSSAAFAGRLGTDVLTVATAVGQFSDKNVANPKTVNISGLSLGGADATNYTLASTTATTAAAITPATITAVAGLSASKVYDGTATATSVSTSGASFTGAVAGDTLTLTAASASFADRNVGTGKALTASGLVLGGTDAGNYTLAAGTASGTGTITQRALSTWSGAGGDGLWSNPLNWDALPDGSNVAAVSIPAGAGTVVFDSSVAATSIETVSSLRPLAIAGGALSISATLAAETLSQSGGALTGAGSLVVTDSFSQTGGSIAMGSLTIVQNSGNLSFTSLSGSTVALVANTGAISQSGPLVAGTLTTSSVTGTNLSNGANQISNLFAENLGSGSITVASAGALNVLGATNAGGDVSVSSGADMGTFGVVSASGSVTLSAGGSSGNLGVFAPVTAGDQVVLAAAGTMTQDAPVDGANGVTADAGLSFVFGTYATARYSPVTYRVGGLQVTAPPESSVPVAVDDTPVETVVEFVALLETLASPLPPPEPDDFNADGTRRKPTEDTIVTEGEVCN